MLDISVIILTYNEEIHIRRCIENIKPVAKDIYVVDSFSTDKTIEIAEESGAKIFQNKWKKNHSKQLNWGLQHLPIQTKWVLRLDADEYFTDALITELKEKLADLPENISGVVFNRRHIFLGKWMKRGTYPVKLLRLFRAGKGICEQQFMDEHIQILEGDTLEFECDFVDHNLNSLDWWISKHVGYSIREAIDLLNIEFNIYGNTEETKGLGAQALAKRKKKYKYSKYPLFWRSFAFFIYRYFFKLGFLEGKEGFLWHFLQGWWYRTLVDSKVYEIKKACGSDKELIFNYVKDKYEICLKD